MTRELAELLGIIVTVLGLGVIVGAAALVSLPLAVLCAGVFMVLIGIVTAYTANAKRVSP